MQNNSQDVSALSAAFINIQKSYIQEILYTGNERPAVFPAEKAIHFTKNEMSSELIIVPTFKSLQSEFSYRDMSTRFNADRERNLILKIYKLPIKKIEVMHTVNDPSLKDSIEKAEMIANEFFFNKNISYLDCLRSFFHSL